MVTQLYQGQTNWSLTQDDEGNRDYKISFQVRADLTDGPFAVLNTPGLPTPGSPWAFDGDVDLWAHRTMPVTVTPRLTKEPNRFWDVELSYSTKPWGKACKDQQIENPLLQPMKVSGGFRKDKEEATLDRFGKPIVNSAWEQIRGPQNEWDRAFSTVKIEQNVADLQLPLLNQMMNTLNGDALWGLPRRTIKLANITWEAKYYGQCFLYYTRNFEFEVQYYLVPSGPDLLTTQKLIPTGWDRDILDEGTKALNGHWDALTGKYVTDNIAGSSPDPKNPAHFIKFKDRNGENTRVVLDGAGMPFDPVNEVVVTCGQCPGGMYKTLFVEDFDTDGVTITYQGASGCTWQGLDEFGALVTLTYGTFAGVDDWKLTYDQFPGEYWLLAPLKWKCKGTNRMEGRNILNDDVPFLVDVAPKEAKAPGKIHVEKYNESNFLLLGIPTILG